MKKNRAWGADWLVNVQAHISLAEIATQAQAEQVTVDMTMFRSWRSLGLNSTDASLMQAARLTPTELKDLDFATLEAKLTGRGRGKLYGVVLDALSKS